MNYEKAIHILAIKDKPLTLVILKKHYYKMALKYHPDKSLLEDTAERFKECNSAYVYLQHYLNVEIEDISDTYLSLIRKGIRSIFPEIQWNDLFLDSTVLGIINNCKKASLKIFKKINKDKALEVYSFLSTHREIFSLSDDILKEMYGILQKKMRRDNIVILNPTMDDLLGDKIYKLEIEERKFMIPLWHHEVCFDVSGADLIVQSLPELEDHIFIDDNNNIICQFKGPIQEVLENKKIILKIGERFFVIQGEKLRIKKEQTYVLRNTGMLRVDEDDLYSTQQRGHIYVEIQLY